jgi:mRNA interferase MazF
MKPTTTYEYGDVLLVWYWHTDGGKQEKRPAVVVSAGMYNRKSPDVVLMPLTSRTWRAKDYGAVEIADWKKAGLLQRSVAKPVFFTYEQQQVIRKLGSVNQKTGKQLRIAVAKTFGFKVVLSRSASQP